MNIKNDGMLRCFLEFPKSGRTCDMGRTTAGQTVIFALGLLTELCQLVLNRDLTGWDYRGITCTKTTCQLSQFIEVRSYFMVVIYHQYLSG
jgi:hypothetical protein